MLQRDGCRVSCETHLMCHIMHTGDTVKLRKLIKFYGNASERVQIIQSIKNNNWFMNPTVVLFLKENIYTLRLRMFPCHILVSDYSIPEQINFAENCAWLLPIISTQIPF